MSDNYLELLNLAETKSNTIPLEKLPSFNSIKVSKARAFFFTYNHKAVRKIKKEFKQILSGRKR